MVMIPLIVWNLYVSHGKEVHYLVAAIAFGIASATDFIDGYLARMWGVQSPLGRFLDPIADKLIISTTIIMLIYVGKISHLDIFPSLVIISREILISGAREFMGNMRIEISVTALSKAKTALQMIAVTFILSSGCGDVFLAMYVDTIGQLLLWIASIFTLYSSYGYLKVPIKYVLNIQ